MNQHKNQPYKIEFIGYILSKIQACERSPMMTSMGDPKGNKPSDLFSTDTT